MSDDLVKQFEPARAAVRPWACNPDAPDCWVRTAKAKTSTNATCFACQGVPTLAGNEAYHMATLRRCMAAQNEVAS